MTVYLAHATSFCSGVWRPVISALGETRSVAWDFAGHGSGPKLEVPVDWRDFASQVIAETEPGGIGVGHSMGGAAMVMAQLADPNRFKALVLVEPIIFPGPHERREHPLSAVAMKRKWSFDSRDGAREHFRSRTAFGAWHPAALDGYVECGLVGDDRVELACSPEVEADVYRASNAHDTWERMGEVEIPVLILAGEESDTTPPDLVRQQGAQFARAGFEVIPGAGHFLPMEQPRLVAERVLRITAALP